MPPSTNYAGGLVLDQLSRFLPEGSLACFTILNRQLRPEVAPELRGVRIAYEPKPREMAFRPLPRKLGSAFALPVETYHAEVTSRALIRRVAEFAEPFSPDAVWCLLEGQTLIRLAAPAARRLGVPLLAHVMDPPDWWVRVHRLDPVSRRRVFAAFDDALRASSACGTASWAMADEYARVYDVRTVPLVPSLPRSLGREPGGDGRADGPFVIGIAGQLYARREWDALIGALRLCGWRLGGRDVVVRLLGGQVEISTSERLRVEYLGWRPQDETVDLLAQADVLYCPYRFGPEFETEARLCFPSKLTTYLAAARPILFHGPEYSSPASFLQTHDAGLHCHSLDPDDILGALRRLARDADYRAALARNAASAFRGHLTLDAQRTRFAEFLQVDESFLQPVG